MKKGWLIGCGVASAMGLLVCSGLAFAIYSITHQVINQITVMTQPVVDASDDFLVLLGQGKISEAYAATSSGFHAQLDEPTFTAAVQKLGLTDYASSSWNSRNINNQEGSVEGTVISKKGGNTPATIQLVYEQGAWKVAGLRYSGVDLVGFIAPNAPKQVPPEAELQRLTTATVMDFSQAIQTRDFTALHEKIAPVWQKEITPQQLQQYCQDLIDKDVNLSGIRDLRAQFDPAPLISDEGFLVVEGSYPIEPNELAFTLKYMGGPAGWKLVGFHLRLGDPK